VNVLIPLICLLPIWFRLMQCLRRYHDTRLRWPNLANAAKYSLAQIVTLFGTFHPLFMFNNAKMRVAGHNEVNDVGGMFQVFWVSIFICSSVYSSCWDVFMDWGLGRVEYKGLGPRLMFPAIWWYYVAIVVDVILRFLWVTSLVPPDSGAQFSLPNYLTSAVMALEILRRTVWGFLRLEQEHRHNTEGYRRVDFVPLHFNTGHEHDRAGADKINKGKGVLGEVRVWRGGGGVEKSSPTKSPPPRSPPPTPGAHHRRARHRRQHRQHHRGPAAGHGGERALHAAPARGKAARALSGRRRLVVSACFHRILCLLRVGSRL
jgi:hypothetical protein